MKAKSSTEASLPHKQDAVCVKESAPSGREEEGGGRGVVRSVHLEPSAPEVISFLLLNTARARVASAGESGKREKDWLYVGRTGSDMITSRWLGGC